MKKPKKFILDMRSKKQSEDYAKEFAKRGYVAVAIDYGEQKPNKKSKKMKARFGYKKNNVENFSLYDNGKFIGTLFLNENAVDQFVNGLNKSMDIWYPAYSDVSKNNLTKKL